MIDFAIGTLIYLLISFPRIVVIDYPFQLLLATSPPPLKGSNYDCLWKTRYTPSYPVVKMQGSVSANSYGLQRISSIGT